MAMFGRWSSPAKAMLMAWAVLAANPAYAADPACQPAVAARDFAGLRWDYRILTGAAGFAAGTELAAGAALDVPADVVVQLCDRDGGLITVRGPVRHILPRLRPAGETAAVPPTRGFAVKKPSAAPAAKPAAAPAKPQAATAPRARTGAARGSSRTVPAYPVWPPETPSSRASLDRFIAARGGMSLYDAGQKLIGSFEDAGYLEHSFYSAPGGFVLVTRIEKIGEDGSALDGAERYRLPNQRSDPSMTDYIRGLFLEAPPGFYRYIAIVVSNEPYRTSGASLADSEAIKRLRAGSNDLDRSFRTIPFSADYKVDALIYEFRKDAQSGKARMIDPGRLPPNTHLARTGLDSAIRKRFMR